MVEETTSSTILSRKSKRKTENGLRLKSNPANCNEISELGYTLNGYYLVNDSATVARFGVFFCQFKLPPGFNRSKDQQLS